MLAFTALCGCGGYSMKRNTVEQEESTRAQKALQDVRDMVRTKELPKIEFEFDSAVLLPESYRTLDQIAQILIAYPHMKLVVEGHCDDVGTDEYNDALSLARAKAVKAYLVELGVYPDYIRTRGYGKRRPVVYGTDDDARALNRRVEFTLVRKNWQTVF